MKIVPISGKAYSGKDTLAGFLKQELELRGHKVLILHYATLLKNMAKDIYGWNGQKDDQGRRLLQKLGTDIVRARDPKFWTDHIVRVIKLFVNDYDYFLIPDTRFPNEVKELDKRFNKVFAVRVERLNFETSLTREQQDHPSETALDSFKFDFYIKAESGVENLMIMANKLAQSLEAK